MGLLRALAGATSSVLADQWREYFYCDSLDIETIVVKGQKRVSSRSSNVQGNNNIISNGSIIAVADGQCMLIVEQGKVVDLCAEPGEFVYDSSTEPSIFAGRLNRAGIAEVFGNIGKRFTFGGDAPKDQRVYYFNTKEFTGNPYGTPAPVPFRVVDKNIGLDIDITIRCFGEYSYRITNPLLFYTNVCGNVAYKYSRSQIDEQLKSELLTSLQPAFAEISQMGIRYSSLPAHTKELAVSLNRVLSEQWKNTRGIEIASLGISSVKASEKDEEMIKELQRNAAFRDPNMAAAQLVGAQSIAMQEAAKNQNAGAAMAFMGMNMAKQTGGIDAQSLFQMGMQKNAKKDDEEEFEKKWVCSCGKNTMGRFCTYCGSMKPEQQNWICPSCGKNNKSDGIFCSYCGEKKLQNASAGQCVKCGWMPKEMDEQLRFCPQCGSPLNI